jgi:hypothetical protein
MNFTTIANQTVTAIISVSQPDPDKVQWLASSIQNGVKSIYDQSGSFLHTTKAICLTANQTVTAITSVSQPDPEKVQWLASSLQNGVKSIYDQSGSFLDTTISFFKPIGTFFNTTGAFFNSTSTYAQEAWTSHKIVILQIGKYSLITIACFCLYSLLKNTSHRTGGRRKVLFSIFINLNYNSKI